MWLKSREEVAVYTDAERLEMLIYLFSTAKVVCRLITAKLTTLLSANIFVPLWKHAYH